MSYIVPFKSKVKILQNFVAFSEYMNFTNQTFSEFEIENSEFFGDGLFVMN